MAITPQQLCDIEEIKQLKASYFRIMDTKQWSRMRALFTDDARCEMSRPFTADEFIANFSRDRGPRISVHHGHMPEIRILSADRARGVWAMMDFVEEFGPPNYGMPGMRGFIGYGHYQEEYRKQNGDWKISFMRLTRLRSDPILGEPKHYPELYTHFLPLEPDWLDVK